MNEFTWKMYYINIQIDLKRCLILICISIYHFIFIRKQSYIHIFWDSNENLPTHQEKYYLN